VSPGAQGGKSTTAGSGRLAIPHAGETAPSPDRGATRQSEATPNLRSGAEPSPQGLADALLSSQHGIVSGPVESILDSLADDPRQHVGRDRFGLASLAWLDSDGASN
jgi:hypothetical protein